jgi:hypothetical protein
MERIVVPFSQVAAREEDGWVIHSAHEVGDTVSPRAMVRENATEAVRFIEAWLYAEYLEQLKRDGEPKGVSGLAAPNGSGSSWGAQ